MQTTIVNFTKKSELDNWVIINDTVMGGRSKAKLFIEDDYLIFSGQLSLQNNGGFASTRRVYAPVKWYGQNQVQLSVLGDGRNYQLRLRTNDNADGIAYVANFTTKPNELKQISFTLQDFTPQFRGRYVRNAEKLKFENVAQLGIMLADKKPGEFRIQVKELRQLSQ